MNKRIVHINMYGKTPSVIITRYPKGKQHLYHPSASSFIRLLDACTDNPKIYRRKASLLNARWTAFFQ